MPTTWPCGAQRLHRLSISALVRVAVFAKGSPAHEFCLPRRSLASERDGERRAQNGIAS